MNQDQLQFDFSLKALFMFNPKAIPTNPKPSEQDQQDAKLIYYYPQTSNIEERRIQTGMAEGIYMFFTQFNIITNNEEEKCNELIFQTIHLESQTHIICKIREDLYLFMTFSHPKIIKIKTIAEEYFYSECHKFHYSVSKNLYTNIAENYIDNFALFYNYDLSQLDQYTWRWMQSNMRTNSTLNMFYFQCQSFKYAAIDSSVFMLLQYLLTLVKQIENSIQDIIVFYNGYFIYSTLSHKLTLLLKEHYYGNGLAWSQNEQKIAQKFLQQEGSSQSFLSFNNLRNLNRESGFHSQDIFIQQQQKNIFTFLEKQFFVILITENIKEFNTLQKVSTALSKNVEKISQKLDTFIEQSNRQDLIKYVYYNGMNLAYRISSQLNITKISSENLRILQSTFEKLNQSNQYIIRTSGIWFVGLKVLDKRVIYLLPATITLSKLDEEVTKITEQTFPNLLL